MICDFPFTIKQVAQILSLPIRHGENGNSTDVDCPFCKRKGKLNLNSIKDVYRCNYCGESGGMVRLYGAVHNISNADAYREICELLDCNGKNPGDYNSPATTRKKEESSQTKRADCASIHQTYSMLLSLLSLTNIHKEQLMARGLSPDDIVKIGYRSVPAFGQQDYCRRLIKSGCVVEGVPGFFKVVDDNGDWNGVWDLKLRAPGVLIPVRGIDGKISALQIRLNKPVNDRKYIWLSSTDKAGGTSSGSPIHFIGDPTAERVYVTEGPLKGTIAHTLTRYTFICLPSANSMGQLDDLLVCLKANGVSEIIEALDMDKETNIHVAKAAAKLRDKLSSFDFTVKSAVWENKELKGVDDYYFHRLQTKRSMVYDVDISIDRVAA